MKHGKIDGLNKCIKRYVKRLTSLFLAVAFLFCCLPTVGELFTTIVKADDDPETLEICELKIRYVSRAYSDNDSQITYVDIYPTYHIKIPYGYAYEVTSPSIDSYVLADPDDAVVADILTESYKVINVVYKESVGTAKYTVNYWTQNVGGTDLTKLDELCYEGEGEVGTSVTVNLPSVPGYSWSNDDLLVYITADGHAVKNVYYVKSEKRKLVFRTGTGYAQLVEAEPGEEITAQRAAIRDVDPIKPGYEFVNWDTSIASLGVQTIYESDGVTVKQTYSCYVSADESADHQDHYYMPADDYIINAVWAKAATPYRVVFWFEKTDGSGYNNGGLDTVRYALTDTEVTAAYYDKLIADEKTLFVAKYSNNVFTGLEYSYIQDITVDDDGNAYNFEESYSQPAMDEDGNVLKDVNGNNVVISYTNTYVNPKGMKYDQYKASRFFGFDYDHCNDVVVTADGHATLNVYYKRETWTVNIYQKPSSFSGNKIWRTVSGLYGSVIPAVENGDADDPQKLPTYSFAEDYYNTNKPSGVSDDFYDLRTSSGTLFNLNAMQVFSSEDNYGLHLYSVYPYYNTGSGATSKRMFYGANLGVSPDSSQNLNDDYVNFAISSSSSFQGTIQPAFIFDEPRVRQYTWEGAKFRYRSCAANTPENEITESWSAWIDIDTTNTLPVNTDSNYLKDVVEEGAAKVIIWENGVAYWYFHNADTQSEKKNFYLEVILPRKELNLNFISHNETLMTKKVACGDSLSSYYSYTPDDTVTEHFVGWYQDAELSIPVDNANVMGYSDISVYAMWEPKQCTVTFDPRNGEGLVTQIMTIGSSLDKPADPVKDGFRFVGWYTEEGSHYLFMSELSDDLALHAVWEPLEMVEYTVKHILKHANGDEEIILQATYYDSAHKTVVVNALTNEDKPFYFYKNLYLIPSDSSSHSQSINLSTDGEHVAIFYYNEMTEWPYTITYLDIDDKTTKIQDDVTDNTDMLSITVSAPTITIGAKTWVPVKSVGKRLSPALAGAILNPVGTNLITIYYDEQHTLKFDLGGGDSHSLYNDRYLVKQETTKLPVAPSYSGHIFLGWNTKADGTGTVYYPDAVYTMPDNDVTLYAQWANAEAVIDKGRLLDKTVSSLKVIDDIAENGAVTAKFSLKVADGAQAIICPNDLKLLSQSAFPTGTVITLIVYPNGSSLPQFYYYKTASATVSIPLTAFVKMGGGSNDKFSSVRTAAFYCQVCVEYSTFSADANTICLSSSSYSEPSTSLTASFGGSIFSPTGGLSVSSSDVNVSSFQTTVTVSSLSGFEANQSSNRRLTNGVLADYRPVLAITLKNASGESVPFPEKCVIKVGDNLVKSGNKVATTVMFNVTAGSYTIEASSLPTYEDITVCFALCAADSDDRPMRLQLASGQLSLTYVEQPKYAIHAELTGDEVGRVFSVSAAPVTLTFDVTTYSEHPIGGEAVTVTSRIKGENGYVDLDEGWTYTTASADGSTTVSLTVPANTPSGTYRLTFSYATAEYHYNIIITDN